MLESMVSAIEEPYLYINTAKPVNMITSLHYHLDSDPMVYFRMLGHILYKSDPFEDVELDGPLMERLRSFRDYIPSYDIFLFLK